MTEPAPDEKLPPLLSTWPRLYGFVLVNLLGWILFFVWVTEHF